MKTRILAAIPITLVVIVAVVLQSWVLFGLVTALAFISQYEILHAVSSKGDNAIRSVPYILCAVIPIIIVFAADAMLILIAFAVSVIAMFLISMFSGKYDYKGLRNSIVALIYPQLLFVFIYLLIIEYTSMQFMASNPFVLLLGLLPSVFCDSLAYFIGSAFGKRKLCPDISPKKTVAGLAGGIMGGAAAGFLVWFFFASGVIGFVYDMSVGIAILVGAVVSFFSQLGDISASFIKRHYAIKDFGRLIPGHGGILDRMDSILFAIPAVYIYMYISEMFC